MKQEDQLKILNEATDKALADINKKRTKSTDFISEFHEWYILCTKYLKQMLNG